MSRPAKTANQTSNGSVSRLIGNSAYAFAFEAAFALQLRSAAKVNSIWRDMPWYSYNPALGQRGSLTVWFDLGMRYRSEVAPPCHDCQDGGDFALNHIGGGRDASFPLGVHQ